MKILKIFGLTLLVIFAFLSLMLYEGDIPKDVIDARYTTIDSQFADFGEHGRIHFRDQGNQRAMPVLLIHGFTASLHTFEPWVELLKDDYRVITMDVPGFGLTGAIPSRDYSDETTFSVINQLTEQLGVDNFVIGGNSMGGGISWRYTLAHPEKVKGLILIDASGNRSWQARPEGDDSAVAGFNLLDQPWFRAIANQLDPYYLVSQGLKASFTNQAVVDEAMIMRYNDMLLREGSRQAIGDRRTAFIPPSEPVSVLADITVPTLVMWGKDDAIIPFSFASVFTDNIPNASTAYYDDVGHIPMEEAPEQSAKDVAEFLAKLTSEPEQKTPQDTSASL